MAGGTTNIDGRIICFGRGTETSTSQNNLVSWHHSLCHWPLQIDTIGHSGRVAHGCNSMCSHLPIQCNKGCLWMFNFSKPETNSEPPTWYYSSRVPLGSKLISLDSILEGQMTYSECLFVFSCPESLRQHHNFCFSMFSTGPNWHRTQNVLQVHF